MDRRRSIELFNDSNFTITETSEGTKIHGMLAYPGISRNGKLYGVEQLMRGHDLSLPVWLNHADTIGLQGVGSDLLPESYRQRLQSKEKIILGQQHQTFNPDTLQLTYEAIITDPFYKQKEVLKRMSVSQGVFHLPFSKEFCDAVACYKIVEGSQYEEMSLVFHPGFSIATLSTENQKDCEFAKAINVILEGSSQEQYTYQSEKLDNSIMTDSTNQNKSGEKTGEADARASGNIGEPAGGCGPGMVWDTAKGACVAVATSGNPVTNANGAPDKVAEAENDDDYTKMMKKKEDEAKKAKEAYDIANLEVEKARKAVEATKDMPDGKDPSPDDVKKKQEAESKKNSTEGYPNADYNDRRKAQEAYNDALEKRFKSQENMLNVNASIMAQNMQFAKENATKNAIIGSNGYKQNLTKSIEAAENSPKHWIDLHIKGDENVMPFKRWKLDESYIYGRGGVVRKFKQAEGFDFRYKSYEDVVKATEATDVAMAGNGAQPDAFQRTLSELVLVYPDGIVVTPIEQFCETKVLEPGKKEALFYDINVPSFAATDSVNMDAGGSGYALVPSEVTINATGGAATSQGGLVRISFDQMEEIPIDVIQKVNIGFAMRAAERKNYEVLTTCWNDMSAYDPATQSRRPKGGGNKFATDNQGNTHMVNGNSGAQLTSTDSGATSALTFAGLIAGKNTIANTGLNVENLFMYLKWGGILQLLKDTSITTYTQRSVPEVITEGVIEKLTGVQLVASNDTPVGDAATVNRAVMFIPTVSFKFVTRRELQIDAERVARQQSVFCTASMAIAAFCQRIESTCGVSFNPAV